MVGAATDIRILICPVNSDFNNQACSSDDHEHGLETVRQALKRDRMVKCDAIEWEQAVSLEQAGIPELSPDILPGVLSELKTA